MLLIILAKRLAEIKTNLFLKRGMAKRERETATNITVL